MKSLNTLADIKDAAKMLDTATVQWLNSGPPDHIQNKLNEARMLLQRGTELADAPLRIALVGEFNSGKTLLLNALLDSTDLFPCLLQPTTGNVLEVRVSLRKEERPAEIHQAQVSFFNQFEIEKILQHFVKNLQNQGLESVPTDVTMRDLDKFENYIIRKYSELRSITPKYTLLSALEFVTAIKAHAEIVEREDRHSLPLNIDLISSALTLSKRPELDKTIQAHHNNMKQLHEQVKNRHSTDRISSGNLRAIFPIIRRVEVDVSAWCVPFGVNDPEEHNTLAFLDFPGLGAENSNARDEYLCMTEISDAHAVLVIFNASNPGASGASAMANLFQRVGKLTTERTIVAVNRFDEFHPLPTGRTVEEYYSHTEQGTTVGFSTISIPAKNLLSGAGGKVKLYVCSALCYLFEEKANRPNWNFGNVKWFSDDKRQSAFTLYNRLQPDFKKLIDAVESGRVMLKDHQLMKESLDRYLDHGGIPAVRKDLIKFTMERGERLVREDALKEIRAAHRLLEEVAPAPTGESEKGISTEVSFAAQEFYRVLELCVADTLPSGPSEYKRLKVRVRDRDVPLWELIESEIAASITAWPEWFAILNQGFSNKPQAPNSPSAEPKRKRSRLSRYETLRQATGEAPETFASFNERFEETAQKLTQFTLECIEKAALYSLQRFENHPDYRAAIDHLQSMIAVDKLGAMEEALPLLDIWNPSESLSEDIVPTIKEDVEEEVEALNNMAYPYDASKPCAWNLALIIRVQVQLVKTYRDRLSRLVAAAENNFQDFFCNDVLRADILPLVRSSLNSADFLGEIATGEAGSSWESVGQLMRGSVEEFKSMTGVPGARPMIAPAAPAAVATLEPEPEPTPAPSAAPAPEIYEEEVADEGFMDDAPAESAPDPTHSMESSDEMTDDAIDEDEFEEW